MKSETEINYLFVRYVQRSLRNSSNAFLKKTIQYTNTHFTIDTIEEFISNSIYDNYLTLDLISESEINNLQNFTENDHLSSALSHLSYKEKKLLFEKYVRCKTDNEIAKNLNISRQAVSISKKRILKKLKHSLKS